jgi:hypothetical protein
MFIKFKNISKSNRSLYWNNRKNVKDENVKDYKGNNNHRKLEIRMKMNIPANSGTYRSCGRREVL